jgi:A/G-specific adenine glycosylase
MMEVPSTAWNESTPDRDEAVRLAPLRASWWPVPGRVAHVFTHFRLEAEVMRVLVPGDATLDLWAEPERCRWVHRSALQREALPSVMRKIIAHGLG